MAMRLAAGRQVLGALVVFAIGSGTFAASGILDRSVDEASPTPPSDTVSAFASGPPLSRQVVDDRSVESDWLDIEPTPPILQVMLPSIDDLGEGRTDDLSAGTDPVIATPQTATTSTPTTFADDTSLTTAEDAVETPSPDTSTSTTRVDLSAAEVSKIEHEIFNWINSFRQDPSGPLRRINPMPTCILLDPTIEIGESGHPAPLDPFHLDASVSETISRAWAQSMADRGAMTHRGHDDQLVLYERLEIPYWAFAESVARGNPRYLTSEIALLLFESWRESDDGHYCPMVTPNYTHIGVGYHLGPDGQHWAALNLYGVS